VLLALAVLAVGALTTAAVLTISQVAGDKPLATDPVPAGDGPARTDAPAGVGSAYTEALDHLDALLVQADDRIAKLGVDIGETAPDVPDSVDEELADLQFQVGDALGALASEEPPQEYLSADDAILSAGDEMLVCLDQTRQGILAMWLSGQVEPGSPYFERGAEAQDHFRSLFDRYRQVRP
jgi:hypothetical protein